MSGIDENRIVRLLHERFGAGNASLVKGIGDDAAVLRLRGSSEHWGAKIVLEVLKEDKTLTEIAAFYEVHPNLLSRWKAEFIKNASRAFNKEDDEIEKVKQSYEKEKDELLKQIGQLSYEVSWLKKKSQRF